MPGSCRRLLSVAAGLSLALSAVAVPAQIDPDAVLVASNALPGPAAGLFEVDPANGQVTALATSALAGVSVRAVTVDPVSLDIVLALTLGSGSVVVRAALDGRTITGFAFLAVMPQALVTDLTVAHGDVFATVLGPVPGLYRVPRHGGSVSLVLAIPDLVALDDARHQGGGSTLLLQNGASAAPVVHRVHLPSGLVYGSWTVARLSGRTLTGIADLVTGVERWFVTDAAGDVLLVENFFDVRSLAALGPGGARAIVHEDGLAGLVIGSGGVQRVGGAAPQPVAAIPGEAVDVARAWGRLPRVAPFTSSCASRAGSVFTQSDPRVGNASFGVTLDATAPGTAAVLVLGVSESVWRGVPLPIALPVTGCPLLVGADLPLPTVSNASGRADVTLPIPGRRALAGEVLFVQWIVAPSNGLLTSDALALHLYP